MNSEQHAVIGKWLNFLAKRADSLTWPDQTFDLWLTIDNWQFLIFNHEWLIFLCECECIFNFSFFISKLCISSLKDCSSVNTFEGVCDVLAHQRPAAFILENVDMETGNNPGKRGKTADPAKQLHLRLVWFRLRYCFWFLLGHEAFIYSYIFYFFIFIIFIIIFVFIFIFNFILAISPSPLQFNSMTK